MHKISFGLSKRWRLTLFGRSLLLIVCELLANAACWVVAGLLFGRRNDTRGSLSLALLAWTIGLRHALDADHISAIDNATRGLISLGQLPVTCGLYFSLGHSTIVIAVNVAIAISTDVYDRINGVGNIGGIVGTAVSASFLFIIGLANSIILFRIIRNRQRRRRMLSLHSSIEGDQFVLVEDPKEGRTIMMRILGPVTRFVNKPWKMYPVGVLFGFGFDTASSIALLAVSALAKKDSKGQGIPQSYIVIFPFLFTAGMTIIDSADSILMLYSYSGFPERSFRLFERRDSTEKKSSGRRERVGVAEEANLSSRVEDIMDCDPPKKDISESQTENVEDVFTTEPIQGHEAGHSRITEVNISGTNEILEVIPIPEMDEEPEEVQRNLKIKENTMSNLSIVLTLISILVAFSISIIEIMGLIGQYCGPCQRAANDPNGGGLAGRWWRGWAKANDDSGFIGAAIVGGFVAVVVFYYLGTWALGKCRESRSIRLPTSPTEGRSVVG